MKVLRVASCQFPVQAEIERNREYILQQMQEAAELRADLAHFSECALSGYAGVEIPHIEAIDRDLLLRATREIMAAAKSLRLWVLLGSTHFLGDGLRPHNSVYVIDSQGKLVDRYDKRFCTGSSGKKPSLDLAHYLPGNHFTTFRVKGVTCGVAICYDYRFPELARGYKRLGAEALFYSFHNARASVVTDPQYDIWKTIVPATLQCRAAENHVWVSATNSTVRPSRFASFTVRADGLPMGRLRLHRPGVLMTEMKMDPNLFDASACWRDVAMSGTLHSGTLVSHPRSENVREL